MHCPAVRVIPKIDEARCRNRPRRSSRHRPSGIENAANLNLLHADGESLDPGSIRLGYLGWQALQNYLIQHELSKKPDMEPWNWFNEPNSMHGNRERRLSRISGGIFGARR